MNRQPSSNLTERRSENESADDSFVMARKPMQWTLPDSDPGILEDAREAVRREFRDSVVWKRLRCRQVSILSETETGVVYLLDVGQAIELDWTWEGAVAFRPIHMKEFANDPNNFFDDSWAEVQAEDDVVWSGEVLEVDETKGHVYVCVSNPESPPITGSFYVRPFEFLGFLHAIFFEPGLEMYRSRLPQRLVATEGGVHPEASDFRRVGLAELVPWWNKQWSVLWGPPGTGKTYTTGQQVARVISDPSERILVVSTTNRATDASSIAIGRAAKAIAPGFLADGALLRLGKGASLKRFQQESLTSMLQGAETAYLAQIESLLASLGKTQESSQKALIRKEMAEVRKAMRDAAKQKFLDDRIRVVVTTAFRATTFLKLQEIMESIEAGHTPFTTIVIDEAGLISRAAVAVLSLLASRRVILVGDSKQLAPISRISRILPTNQMKWLAMSGLSHLDSIRNHAPGVHVLREQRRMHPQVGEMVSHYQYDDFLATSPDVLSRDFTLPELLKEQPRAIWLVLDESGEDLPSIRAERGPGNRSWLRAATPKILDKLFSSSDLGQTQGLFITPFKAQARAISNYFATREMDGWGASTVHSQQGAEADIVLFDTVNAGSYSWPYDEWQRLVNVAVSRAREAVIVLASRAEMTEPYLRPLIRHLAPRGLGKTGRKFVFEPVPATIEYASEKPLQVHAPRTVGYQLSQRKGLRPVLSHEQERLCGLALDGKPRLVRGVAGSGKTVVLAHWLMQTVKRLRDEPNIRIWAVFANRSLQSLISDSIVSAWQIETGGKPFPWHLVSLKHIREILDVVLPEAGLVARSFGFEYDLAAAAYLERMTNRPIQPRCDALFVDEAQDMGPNTMKLLASLTLRTDGQDSNSRSVNIFYDNAQNIYGRGVPTWSELGLDMRGRSTVMKESFRSTRPITEFALNVLYRLQPPASNPDHRELVARGLIERVQRPDCDWWAVRFNQIDGPKPEFRRYPSVDQEFAAIAEYCRVLIEREGVQPSDICLLYNSEFVRTELEKKVAPVLKSIGAELSIQTNQPFGRSPDMVLATTSASFKGYDAEVVIIPGVDFYRATDKGLLPNNLYVAMTRARSILTLFAHQSRHPEARRLFQVLEECLDQLHERPVVDSEISLQDDLIDLLDILGHEHQKWLSALSNRWTINQEPIVSASGEIIAEPLFSVETGTGIHACFGHERPRQRVLQRLEDAGIHLLEIGGTIDGRDHQLESLP